MKKEIRTVRLLLRRLEIADAEALAAAANDWDVVRMLTRLPFPYTVEAARAFIESIQRRRAGEWGVFTDRLIGCIGVTSQLGYWYGRAYWGKGYAIEAAAAVLARLFSTSRVRGIDSGAFEENAASRRVLAKLGFVETGRSTRYSLARDSMVPHVDMRLDREDWSRGVQHSDDTTGRGPGGDR